MTQQKPINWYPLVILSLTAALVLVFALLAMEKSRTKPVTISSHPTLETGSEQIYRWRMVTTWPKNFPGLGTTAETFARYVAEMSAGRLQVQVYGANEIVPAMGVFDAVSAGSVEMGHGGAYYWRGKAPAAQFFTTIPFGMNAQEMNGWLHHGGGLELWREVYAPFNVIPFAGGNTGIQMAGWFTREINTIEDLRGLKMRIPGMAGDVFNRAGGIAVNIPGGELYTALQTGVIDAAEWVGPENDLAFGFHQIAKYYYYPGWQEPGSTLELIVNKQAFESLPRDLQAMVTIAARAANQDMLDRYTANNHAALKELTEQKGVQLRQLPDPVLQHLRDIAMQLYAEQSAQDPMFNRVYDSYKSFLDKATEYHKISEHTYYEVREKTLRNNTLTSGEKTGSWPGSTLGSNDKSPRL